MPVVWYHRCALFASYVQTHLCSTLHAGNFGHLPAFKDPRAWGCQNHRAVSEEHFRVRSTPCTFEKGEWVALVGKKSIDNSSQRQPKTKYFPLGNIEYISL